jgi:hypothetical protein
LASAQEELLEERAQHAVEMGDAKQEVVRLKGVARSLAANSSLGASSALQGLEEDVAKLSKDNEALRGRNLELELRALEGNLGQGGGGGGADVAAELGRKLRGLQRDAGVRRQGLVALRAALRARDNDVFCARSLVASLEEKNKGLVRERSKTLAQVAALKQRLRFLDGERAASLVVSRGSDVVVVGPDPSSGSDSDSISDQRYQGCRVPSHARETSPEPRLSVRQPAPEIVHSPAKAHGVSILRQRLSMNRVEADVTGTAHDLAKNQGTTSPPPKLLRMPVPAVRVTSAQEHDDMRAAGQERRVEFMDHPSDVRVSADEGNPAVAVTTSSLWETVVEQASVFSSPVRVPVARDAEGDLTATTFPWLDPSYAASQDLHASPQASVSPGQLPSTGLTPLMRLVDQHIEVAGVGVAAAASTSPTTTPTSSSAGSRLKASAKALRAKPPPLPFEKDGVLFATAPDTEANPVHTYNGYIG